MQHNQNLWGAAKVVIREFTVMSISKTRKNLKQYTFYLKQLEKRSPKLVEGRNNNNDNINK